MEEKHLETEVFDSEILIVSFGTSYIESLESSICFIEKKFYDHFHREYIIESAFTSPTIIKILREKNGKVINSVSDALENAIQNNIKNIVVQPTHIMDGFDYGNVIKTVRKYEQKFEKVSIGDALLSSYEDCVKVSNAVINASKQYRDNKTAICFVGHGSRNESNEVYGMLQNVLNKTGCSDYYIGTVEQFQTKNNVFELMQKKHYERVILWPLMIVAGNHAYNDIAGNDGSSWKSFFESKGYETICIKRGLGELSDIADIFLQHTINAVRR